MRIDATVADVERVVGRWATISGTDGACVMEMGVDTLQWPVMALAGLGADLGADLTVESPPELVDRVADIAARFARAGVDALTQVPTAAVVNRQ